MRRCVLTAIGLYVVCKYRRRIEAVGVQAAALQMRKQGYPLSITRAVLLGY